MATTPSTRNRLILLALWAVFYASFALFVPPLLDDADSVHAEVAREMVLRHDWVTLYANGIRYLEKAPILYWSMAASFKLFGVSTAAARLPIALTVLALALFLEAFARRAFSSDRAGLYAGLMALSSFGIFIFTRITIPDADVCLWLTLALLAFWTTEQAGSAPRPSDPERASSIRARFTLPKPDPTLPLRKGSSSRPALKAQPYPRPHETEGEEHVEYKTTEPLPPGFDYEHWDRSDTRVHTAYKPERRATHNIWKLGDRRATQTIPCLIFAAACAINVLTKGLIGIVFPVGIVLVYLFLTRGPAGTMRRLRNLHPFAGVLVFLLLAAPWHILIGLANPTQGNPPPITHLDGAWQVPLPTDGNVHGWFWFYFVNEHLLRYLNLRVPRDYDTVPLALFWGLLLVWLMPWSAFLFHAIARVPLWTALKQIPWKIPDRRGAARAPASQSASQTASQPTSQTAPAVARGSLTPLQKTNLLLGLWAATPLLFFSLSTRQEYYVLPAMPALILLLAGWLARESDNTERAGKRIAGVLAGIGLAAALACVFFILHTQTPAANTDLASLLQQNPGDYALSMGHFLDLNAQALGMFRLPLLLTALAFGVGLPVALLLRLRNKPHAANLTTAGAAFVFLLAAHLGLQTFSPVLSSERLAEAIAPHLHPEDLVVLHGEYEAGSTLGFYLRRNDLHICEGRSSNLWYGSFFPDAPKIFETRESIAEKWSGGQRIFLWQDPSDKDRPVLPLAPAYVIATSGGKQILSNQPNR